jgi:hypothetical protein
MHVIMSAVSYPSEVTLVSVLGFSLNGILASIIVLNCILGVYCDVNLYIVLYIAPKSIQVSYVWKSVPSSSSVWPVSPLQLREVRGYF